MDLVVPFGDYWDLGPFSAGDSAFAGLLQCYFGFSDSSDRSFGLVRFGYSASA